MAYLDDNNENLYTQGDPLEELDKELAELRASLGRLEGAETAPPEKVTAQYNGSGRAESEAGGGKASFTEQPTRSAEVSTLSEAEENMKRTAKKPAHAADKPENGGNKRLPLIILAIVLSAAALTGICFGAARLFASGDDEGSTTATAAGEMVTINDSVMGDINLQTVKGAEINTYTADNLSTDENGYYAYYEDGKKISHLGIDLSEYQGEVDFEAVKNAGVEFVMLRIGGRYYGDEGGLYEDSAFETYYEEAKDAGLKVGAYFFSQAVSAGDAVEEANFTVEELGGKKLDYPIAFDWENIEQDAARTDSVTGDELTLIAEAFCNAVADAGYKPIVYSNSQQMFVMYDFETMKDYDFWLADYREFPSMYYNYDMWQYSMDGSVDGIEGTVDLNISFTDFT